MTDAERQQRHRAYRKSPEFAALMVAVVEHLGFDPKEQPRFRRELLNASRAIERALKVADGDPRYVNKLPRVRSAWRNIAFVMRQIDRKAAAERKRARPLRKRELISR